MWFPLVRDYQVENLELFEDKSFFHTFFELHRKKRPGIVKVAPTWVTNLINLKEKKRSGGAISTRFFSFALNPFSFLFMHIFTSTEHFKWACLRLKILSTKITSGHGLHRWVQRSLMAFYFVVFPFLLAFPPFSVERLWPPNATGWWYLSPSVWLLQLHTRVASKSLFLFLMSSTCLT